MYERSRIKPARALWHVPNRGRRLLSEQQYVQPVRIDSTQSAIANLLVFLWHCCHPTDGCRSRAQKLLYLNAITDLLRQRVSGGVCDNGDGGCCEGSCRFTDDSLRVSGVSPSPIASISVREIALCLRTLLVVDSGCSQVRAGTWRVLRALIRTRHDVHQLLSPPLLLDQLIVRSLESVGGSNPASAVNIEANVSSSGSYSNCINDDDDDGTVSDYDEDDMSDSRAERVQALQLARVILAICPDQFPHSITRCLLAIIEDRFTGSSDADLNNYNNNAGVNVERCGAAGVDRCWMLAVATLCQLAALAGDRLIACGGHHTLANAALQCQHRRIVETIVIVLIRLADRKTISPGCVGIDSGECANFSPAGCDEVFGRLLLPLVDTTFSPSASLLPSASQSAGASPLALSSSWSLLTLLRCWSGLFRVRFRHRHMLSDMFANSAPSAALLSFCHSSFVPGVQPGSSLLACQRMLQLLVQLLGSGCTVDFSATDFSQLYNRLCSSFVAPPTANTHHHHFDHYNHHHHHETRGQQCCSLLECILSQCPPLSCTYRRSCCIVDSYIALLLHTLLECGMLEWLVRLVRTLYSHASSDRQWYAVMLTAAVLLGRSLWLVPRVLPAELARQWLSLSQLLTVAGSNPADTPNSAIWLADVLHSIDAQFNAFNVLSRASVRSANGASTLSTGGHSTVRLPQFICDLLSRQQLRFSGKVDDLNSTRERRSQSSDFAGNTVNYPGHWRKSVARLVTTAGVTTNAEQKWDWSSLSALINLLRHNRHEQHHPFVSSATPPPSAYLSLSTSPLTSGRDGVCGVLRRLCAFVCPSSRQFSAQQMSHDSDVTTKATTTAAVWIQQTEVLADMLEYLLLIDERVCVVCCRVVDAFIVELSAFIQAAIYTIASSSTSSSSSSSSTSSSSSSSTSCSSVSSSSSSSNVTGDSAVQRAPVWAEQMVSRSAIATTCSSCYFLFVGRLLSPELAASARRLSAVKSRMVQLIETASLADEDSFRRGDLLQIVVASLDYRCCLYTKSNHVKEYGLVSSITPQRQHQQHSDRGNQLFQHHQLIPDFYDCCVSWQLLSLCSRAHSVGVRLMTLKHLSVLVRCQHPAIVQRHGVALAIELLVAAVDQASLDRRQMQKEAVQGIVQVDNRACLRELDLAVSDHCTHDESTNTSSVCLTNSSPTGVTTSVSAGVTTSGSTAMTTSGSTGVTTSVSAGVTTSTSTGVTTSVSAGVTTSASTGVTTSASTGDTTSVSTGVTTSASAGVTTSGSTGVAPTASAGVTTSGSTGVTASGSTSVTTSCSTGVTTSASTGVTTSASTGVNTSASTGVTTSGPTGVTISASDGLTGASSSGLTNSASARLINAILQVILNELCGRQAWLEALASSRLLTILARPLLCVDRYGALLLANLVGTKVGFQRLFHSSSSSVGVSRLEVELTYWSDLGSMSTGYARLMQRHSCDMWPDDSPPNTDKSLYQGVHCNRLSGYCAARCAHILPHFYGQLFSHCDGANYLRNQHDSDDISWRGYIARCLKCIVSAAEGASVAGDLLQSALWCLGSIAWTERGANWLLAVNTTVRVRDWCLARALAALFSASSCQMDVRATCYLVLGLCASTEVGSVALRQFGWHATTVDWRLHNNNNRNGDDDCERVSGHGDTDGGAVSASDSHSVCDTGHRRAVSDFATHPSQLLSNSREAYNHTSTPPTSTAATATAARRTLFSATLSRGEVGGRPSWASRLGRLRAPFSHRSERRSDSDQAPTQTAMTSPSSLFESLRLTPAVKSTNRMAASLSSRASRASSRRRQRNSLPLQWLNNHVELQAEVSPHDRVQLARRSPRSPPSSPTGDEFGAVDVFSSASGALSSARRRLTMYSSRLNTAVNDRCGRQYAGIALSHCLATTPLASVRRQRFHTQSSTDEVEFRPSDESQSVHVSATTTYRMQYHSVFNCMRCSLLADAREIGERGYRSGGDAENSRNGSDHVADTGLKGTGGRSSENRHEDTCDGSIENCLKGTNDAFSEGDLKDTGEGSGEDCECDIVVGVHQANSDQSSASGNVNTTVDSLCGKQRVEGGDHLNSTFLTSTFTVKTNEVRDSGPERIHSHSKRVDSVINGGSETVEKSPEDAVKVNSDSIKTGSGSANNKSDPAKIGSDSANINSDPVHTSSDSANINSDPVHSSSDSANINSDPVHSSSDSANINSDPVHTSSDSANTNSDSVHTNSDSANINSDSVHTSSDSANINSDVRKTSSDSSNTTSDLIKISSDSAKTNSDQDQNSSDSANAKSSGPVSIALWGESMDDQLNNGTHKTFKNHTESRRSPLPNSTTTTTSNSNPTQRQTLLRSEVLRLASLLSTGVASRSAELALLNLKRRHSQILRSDLCLYTELCHMISADNYGARARRFLHELFEDVRFDDVVQHGVRVLVACRERGDRTDS